MLKLVFTYLALWRLEELGFDQFRRFVLCYNPLNMANFIGFLFNPVTINEKLKPKWVTFLDHEYLQQKMIEPILNNIHLSQNLLQELIQLTRTGQNFVDIGEKKITKAAPFSLTPTKAKNVPLPSKEESKMNKATAVPKGLFKENKILLKLNEIKKDNLAKAKQGRLESEAKLFRAAKVKPAMIVAKIRQKVMDEEKQRMNKPPVKPVPHFNPVNIKLTTAAILKRNMLLFKQRGEQEKNFNEFEMGLRDSSAFEHWQEEAKEQEKLEYQSSLELKRLQVQLLHEDTFVAKQEKFQENKEKAMEIIKSKQENMLANQQKERDLEVENKKKVEYVNDIKQGIKVAREKLKDDKTRNALEMTAKSKRILKDHELKKQQEMKEKQLLIQQIKAMEKNSNPSLKELDLTESSGLGLLGEMSIVELRERVSQAQISENEKIIEKRKLLNQQKQDKQKDLMDKLRQIEQAIKPIVPKPKKAAAPKFDSPELKILQQIVLEKKRGTLKIILARMMMTAANSPSPVPKHKIPTEIS